MILQNLNLQGSILAKARRAASAAIYSLIESAKANGLKPYFYLRYLFDQLPLAETEDDYRNLLPQSLSPDQIALPAE